MFRHPKFITLAILGLAVALVYFAQPHPAPSPIPRRPALEHPRVSADKAQGAAANHAIAASVQTAVLSATRTLDPAVPAPTADENALVRVHRDALQNVFPGVKFPVFWGNFRPDSLAVSTAPGQVLTFQLKQFEQSPQRNTWIGTSSAQGASLVYCASGNLWDGVVTIPGANQYHIHANNDGVTVTEFFEDLQVCAEPIKSAARVARAVVSDAASTGVASADAAAPIMVDILCVYSPEIKETWGATKEEIMNRYATYLAAGNTFLANSLISNFQFNLVDAMEAVGYGYSGLDTAVDLTAVSTKSTPLGAPVDATRFALKADLVQFIVGKRENAGQALMPGDFSVMNMEASIFSFIHELAHNFGCNHDRAACNGNTYGPNPYYPVVWNSGPDPSVRATDNDGKYNYGVIYRTPYTRTDPVTGDPVINPLTGLPIIDSTLNGTIMAYCEERVPYFSNPNVIHGTYALGVAVGEPKAAYNAKILQDNAARVAANNGGHFPPHITKQPVGQDLYVGNPLGIVVFADGTDLSFQWQKDGRPVVNTPLNFSSYTLTWATLGDAGVYSVIVSNDYGAEKSVDVTVTVTSNSPVVVPPTPNPVPASSSSSGGGGACSADFLAALLAVVAFRSHMKKRSKSQPDGVCSL